MGPAFGSLRIMWLGPFLIMCHYRLAQLRLFIGVRGKLH